MSTQKARLGARAGSVVVCAGVVFGDIGTSPLYALQAATKAASPTAAIAPEAVLGIVSLIFWSLIVIISVKYAILIMRATNHGEGGILALLALVSPQRAKSSGWRAMMVVIGLIGATLLYGDGTLTPAISVLSATLASSNGSPTTPDMRRSSRLTREPAWRDGAKASSRSCTTTPSVPRHISTFQVRR
jgi:K+ transporter